MIVHPFILSYNIDYPTVELNRVREESGLCTFEYRCMHDLDWPQGTFVQEETVYNNIPSFEGVVLGGTFDHLHAGHKILLSVAVIICARYMEIGITGILANKH